MPFNETNDYTSSRWQETSDTSQVTSSPPSCAQGCCGAGGTAGWAGQAGVRSGSPLPGVETPSQASRWVYHEGLALVLVCGLVVRGAFLRYWESGAGGRMYV